MKTLKEHLKLLSSEEIKGILKGMILEIEKEFLIKTSTLDESDKKQVLQMVNDKFLSLEIDNETFEKLKKEYL